MALLLFPQGILQQLVLYRHLGIHLLQPPVLISHRFHFAHQRGVHAAKFAAPVVKSSVADPVLAAKIRNRNTALALIQNSRDLRVTKFRFFSFHSPRL